MAGWIEVLFEVEALGDPWYIVLNGILDHPEARVTLGEFCLL